MATAINFGWVDEDEDGGVYARDNEEGGGRGTYYGVAGALGAVGVMLTTRAALRAAPDCAPSPRGLQLGIPARTSAHLTPICDFSAKGHA